MTGNRRTTLALLFAILLARLMIDGRMQAFWHALWGPMQGLGEPFAQKEYVPKHLLMPTTSAASAASSSAISTF